MKNEDGAKMAEMLARAAGGAPLGDAFDRLVLGAGSNAMVAAAHLLAEIQEEGIAVKAAREWAAWARAPGSAKAKYWRSPALRLSTAGGLAWMRARDGMLGAEGAEWMRGLKDVEFALGTCKVADWAAEACEELSSLPWLAKSASAGEKALLASAWLGMGGSPDAKAKKTRGTGDGPPIVDWALGPEGGWPIALALAKGGAKPMRGSWGNGRHAAMQILCEGGVSAPERASACVELCEMFGMGPRTYVGKDKESMGMAATKALSASPEAGAGVCGALRALGVGIGSLEGDWLAEEACKALGRGSGRHARKVLALALEALGDEAPAASYATVLSLTEQARLSSATSVGYGEPEAAPEWAELLGRWCAACRWGAAEAEKLGRAWPALEKQPCFAAWRESLELAKEVEGAARPASARRSL